MKEEHLDRLRRSADEWNGWRGDLRRPIKEHSEHELIVPKAGRREHFSYYGTPNQEIEEVDLSYADLRNFDFKNSNLTNANLSFSDLRGSNLSLTILAGAQLQFVKYSDATLWPSNFELPDNAIHDRGVKSTSNRGSANTLQASGSEQATVAFEENLTALYSVLKVIQLALPERPNDGEQQELLAIVEFLSQKVFELHLTLESKEKQIETLEKELEFAKGAARSELRHFLRKSGESVADQVGPTLKWLVASGSVTAIAAQALKTILGS